MFISKKKKRKGQSTLEYAVLIAIVVGALITMQIYIKRGIQGRLRSSSDDIGEQFSPGRTTSLYTYKSDYTALETVADLATKTEVQTQKQERIGSETVETEEGEWWPE